MKSVIEAFYKVICKPIFFRFDPEKVHDEILVLGQKLGHHRFGKALTSKLLSFSDSSLSQEILGIHFPNPIGLGAGFDKNAELLDIMPAVGFGFTEVGSITGETCPGNPKPRLWRLKNSRSLQVYYGLKNEGATTLSEHLRQSKCEIPFGINIAKTNSRATVKTEAGLADYVKAYQALKGIGSYVTINISCPNAFGGEPFTDPASLELLLTAIDRIADSRPIFLKISPDLTDLELDQIIAVVNRHKISGFVAGNLTKNLSHAKIKDELKGQGGLSGKIVEDLSNTLIERLYRKTSGRYVIIGLGGVFTAEDAYKKIKLGASLVQLITGLIYEGPQMVGQINQGLVKLLKKDGFHNISEAVGKNIN